MTKAQQVNANTSYYLFKWDRRYNQLLVPDYIVLHISPSSYHKFKDFIRDLTWGKASGRDSKITIKTPIGTVL